MKWKNLWGFSTDDPVKYCETFKKSGCAHVDGYLCDMRTCQFKILMTSERKNKIHNIFKFSL